MKLKQKIFRLFNVTQLFYVVLVCLLMFPSLAFAENRVEAERQNLEVLLSRSGIYSLLLSDDKKSLWVGTTGGLEERDAISGKIKKVYTKQNGLPDNLIVSLLSDGQGGLWVITYYSIARLKAGETWDIYNFRIGSAPPISDGQGGLWMAILINELDGGIVHLKSNGNWQVFDEDNSELPSNNVRSLLPDQHGGLWVGTKGGGLAHLKSNGSWQIFDENNSELPGIYVSSLLMDDNGGLWIGTMLGGLAHLKSDGSWQIFDENNSELPRKAWIPSLISDGQGGLWMKINKSGIEDSLAHFKADGKWEVFNTDNSDLPDNGINSLILDGQGGLWIGTVVGGLAHFKADGKWEVFNTDNSDLPDNGINSLILDGQGGLWIGTWGKSIARLDSNYTWRIFDEYIAELPNHHTTEIILDGHNGLWVGTDIGLTHLKSDGIWQVFDTDNSDLPDNTVWSLLSDSSGSVWVGTSEGGLAHLKTDGKWEVFNKDNSNLPSNRVNSLILDSDDSLWVGTSEGLAHFNADGSWDIFDEDNSELPNEGVWSLVSDGEGGVWMATASGLAHLMPDGSWQIFDEDNSELLGKQIIQCIISDGYGGLLVGKGVNETSGIVHLKQDGSEILFKDIYALWPYGVIKVLESDNQSGLWVGTYEGGGIAYLRSDGKTDIFNTNNSDLPINGVNSFLSDGKGGLWITGIGLSHLLLLGSPEQIIKPNSPEITINWFLNASSLDYQNVKYIELQRSLSQDGVYETVLDASDKPVRFYADYSICPKPRVDNCWVTVEGHTPKTKTNPDGSTTKGYTLNIPINDPEWLEGLPRYYRLSAVIEEDGKLVRVANNSEAALITPQVEEKPRVELTLDRNAIAMLPNTKAEITVFVSSLDLFRGDVELEIESGDGVTNLNNINAKLESSTISLKSGETKPVLLTIDAFSENKQSIKIIPKIQSGYSGKSTSLNVQVGDGTTPMIALSIAHKTKRIRVLDALTISGNVIPAQAGQKVVISGNNIMESVDSSNSSEFLTLTTDENGYFQGTVTPIHAGLLTLIAQSNGITSNNTEIFILSARTNIALSSNVNQSTKKGDILKVQGIITPVRLDGTSQNGTEINDIKVNLDIRYLDPANQDAGLQPQFVGGVEIDANGVFYRDVVVPGDGFINVKASLPETSDYLSINTKLVIPIGQPVGEGIIVVSESGDADFQNISKSLGSYVYNALKSRNIPAERIKYLGIADDPKFTNGTANKANLHDALTNWATTLFSTDDPYKTPLKLYLIGKVEDENNGFKNGNNGFRLNDSEVLTADDLAKYLNEAEEIIKTNSKDNYSEYKGFPVTIVLEGTQSGKWIEKIAGNGRIILTSSSDKPVDEGGFAGYDNLGESSFSRYFYEFINYGSDIEGSFAEANYEILKFYRHTQRPVMDADGDGVGTTNYDRYEASGKFIEYRPSGNLRPQIRTTNPDMTINRRIGVSGSQSNVDNPILWAIATDPEQEMDGVFCSITDPSNKTVNIEMKPNIDNKNAYEIDLNQTYPNLGTGCYQAVYYAKDKAGNVSLPEQKFLNVITSSGVILESPKMKITTQGNMVTFSWSEVPNALGYKLFYCPYPDCPPADIGEIDMKNQREITFDGKGLAFYGAVKAYNNGLSGWSNVEFFDLR
ncbi:MAG: hypothetical protein HQK64_09720 [Desulfamplus sp.]|nr:hypothetical protein [Desulfamplus sp.]